MRGFELLGTDATEMAVSTRPIVERFDVVSDVGHGQFAVLVDPLLDPLFRQAAEEGLGYGIVPAIRFSAHAGRGVMRTAEAPPSVAGVLDTLIRMNDCAACATAPHRHEHGIEREFRGAP